MILATSITAIATVVLAFFACQSNKLAREIKRANDLKDTEDKDFKQRVSDLYQAIVIATLVASGRSGMDFGSVRDSFKAHYKGKTVIFEK